MLQIGKWCAESATATTADEALAAAEKIRYPVIVRAVYALGALSSGFVQNEMELQQLCGKAFATSPQVLVEKRMKGWKEIEYEVVRDCQDNCIMVCNMEVSSLSRGVNDYNHIFRTLILWVFTLESQLLLLLCRHAWTLTITC